MITKKCNWNNVKKGRNFEGMKERLGDSLPVCQPEYWLNPGGFGVLASDSA